jgi:RNA polymerase sigma-70 factor (ECF subfamily)
MMRSGGDVRSAGSLASVTVSGGPRPQAPTGSESGPQLADESGIKKAFVAHRVALTGVARRVLGSAHLAEEAVQETFVRAWRSRDRFDPDRGSLRTWLFSIERNLLIDMTRTDTRRELRVSHSGDDIETVADDVTDQVERAMASWQVEEAIRRLTPEHRTVLVAMYFDGRTSREMAEQLAIPEGTVRSRLFYALRSMKAILEETGWDR